MKKIKFTIKEQIEFVALSHKIKPYGTQVIKINNRYFKVKELG